jgi:hypothetical protein
LPLSIPNGFEQIRELVQRREAVALNERPEDIKFFTNY